MPDPSGGYTVKQPKGSNSTTDVGLPSGEFDPLDAINGCIGSWQVGDYNYDFGDPFHEAMTNNPGGLSGDDVKRLASIKYDATLPGLFNLPVLQTVDLIGFPYASDGATLGCFFDVFDGNTLAHGSKETRKLFKDNINKDLRKFFDNGQKANSAYNQICHTYIGTISEIAGDAGLGTGLGALGGTIV